MAFIAYALSGFFMSLPVVWPGLLFVFVLLMIGTSTLTTGEVIKGCLGLCMLFVVIFAGGGMLIYYLFHGRYLEMVGVVIVSLVLIYPFRDAI